MSLFENENIELSYDSVPSGEAPSHEEINSKYSKGEVRIITEQARYPLNTILSLVESPSYILNPEFQRRHRWDTARKSKLIESFIMNVPIPPIFLYESEYSVYEVMDGLQRLTAISQFYRNEFQLEGLVEWSELNGMDYQSLPDQIRKGIDRRYISSIILLQETAKTEKEANRLKQLVFERINSGGEKLKAQEIRNALYPGKLNSLTIKLARDPNFCKLWDIPEPDAQEIENNVARQEVVENKYFKDMSDAELCLRFISYRQMDKWQGNTMEIFLDEFLRSANTNFDDDVLNSLESLFKDTTKLAFDIFGKKAFWLHRKREQTWFHFERATKILYDPMMQVLSTLLANKVELVQKKDQIIEKTVEFHKENFDAFKGRDTNKTKVQERIDLLERFFKSFIDEVNS